MNGTDVICPCCGAVNRHLYLGETGGWFECIKCGTVAKADATTGAVDPGSVKAAGETSRRAS